MNKKIEELAKDLKEIEEKANYNVLQETLTYVKKYNKYNSKEEYEDLSSIVKTIREQVIQEIRKETAREILKLVKQKSWCYQEDENGKAWTYSITVTQLKELAKQYGVEIKD